MPALTLKSGTVLRQAVAKSFNETGVVIRHQGGFQTVRYQDFPDELSAAVLARRPAPKSAADRQREAAEREARIQAEKARSEAATRAQAQKIRSARATAQPDPRRSQRAPSEDEMRRVKRDALRLVSFQVNQTGVLVNVINETDYAANLEWRQLRGVRGPGDYVVPLDAKTANGTDDFTVAGRSRMSFQLIFSEHANTPIKGVEWN